MAIELASLIDNLELPIKKINEERNYWLVRTQAGEYHDEFYFDAFIAIGWNEFSDKSKFNDDKRDEVISEISKIYEDHKAPGRIYGQIERFLFEMQIGDIVMIPTKNSTHISFGTITSEAYIEKISETSIEEGDCHFIKRRNVQWIKTVSRKSLDPYLFRMMSSHNTINNANDYDYYIDKTLNSFYLKNDNLFFVLDVKEQKDISYVDLLEVLNGTLSTVDTFNNFTQSKLDKRAISIKANVQSPGTIVLIGSVAIIGIGLVLHYIIGGRFNFNLSFKGAKVNSETEGLIEKFCKLKSKKIQNEIYDENEKLRKTIERLKIETPSELSERSNESTDET